MHTGIQDNAAYNANRKRASQAHTPQFYSHQLQPSYAPEPPNKSTLSQSEKYVHAVHSQNTPSLRENGKGLN